MRPIDAGPASVADSEHVLKVFLCGDVMLGRGVDQILPHPGDPVLRERWVTDARDYVALTEASNGPIPRPAGFDYPWGDALDLAAAAGPDVRVINLETTITAVDQFAPGKSVHYRMHPANVPCLTAFRPDVCVLANNHVLDFGRDGLVETLDVLAEVGVRTVGAGRDATQAWRPVSVWVSERVRVLVLAFGMPSSGVPAEWAANDRQAGVAFLPELSKTAAGQVIDRLQEYRTAADVVIVSVHWGSNWGYQVPEEQVRFAHYLVDAGVDVVHGHSSHHPRPHEVYRGRLVLYGCGDFLNDYEGIGGHEAFRAEVRAGYIASLDVRSGELVRLRIVPLRSVRMRLSRAPQGDAKWLESTLQRGRNVIGTRMRTKLDRSGSLDWHR